MIAYPRRDVPLAAAIEYVRRGGFSEIVHVFCEPGFSAADMPGLTDIIYHVNAQRTDGTRNAVNALRWLLEHGHEEWLLLLEDDVELCAAARARLVEGIAKFPQAGVFSLYTPAHDEPFVWEGGWVSHNPGVEGCGTQAICYRRDVAIRAITEIAWPASYYPLDYLMFRYFREQAIPVYFHNPSLAEHRGVNTHSYTIWHQGLNYRYDSPELDRRLQGERSRLAMDHADQP